MGMSAYSISTPVARDVHTKAGYRSTHNEDHALIRKVLTGPGDIELTESDYLDITLDPMHTGQDSAEVDELCEPYEHLTQPGSRFPSNNRILRFAFKKHDTRQPFEFLILFQEPQQSGIKIRILS